MILQVVPYSIQMYFSCVTLAKLVCDFDSSIPDFDSKVSQMLLIICSSRSPTKIEITSMEAPET